MTMDRKLGEVERQALGGFFAMLDDDDLRRFDKGIDRYGNTMNWWFRDLLTEEMQRRGLL